jgi:hypothetical protein
MTLTNASKSLTERHEALTQAVDLLAAMYQQNERRMAQVLDAINRLANIAEAHDVRLDDHEHILRTIRPARHKEAIYGVGHDATQTWETGMMDALGKVK